MKKNQTFMILDQADKVDLGLVGNKAFNLARLSKYVAVKPGFVLPSNITSLGVFPVLPLKTECLYAVRSSAIGEDGLDFSWSGQFETVLNVESKEIINAIKKVTDGVLLERVLSYQEISGVKCKGIAVIVQEMVNAFCSGVMFTCNPQSGEDMIVIEVVKNLADKLVSGLVEPYRYYIEKNTGSILFEEGKFKSPLTVEQVKDLVKVGIIIENDFKFPQDIEWAYEDSVLFINQSRNITGLNDKKNISRFGLMKEVVNVNLKGVEQLRKQKLFFENNIFSDQNIAELITPDPGQMSFGMFTYVFAHGNGAIKIGRNEMGYDIGDELNEGFFELIGGQPRCSILHDALTYRIKGFSIKDYSKLVRFYLKEINSDESKANYPEVVLYNQTPSKVFLISLFGKTKGNYLFEQYQNHEKLIKLQETFIKSTVSSFRDRWISSVAVLNNKLNDKKLSLDQLVNVFFEISELLRTDACIVFVKVARLAFFAYTRLRNQLVLKYGEMGEQYANELTAGLDWDLNPNFEFQDDLFLYKNNEISLKEIIRKFGHLSSHELKLEEKRYSEQPEMLKLLASKISNSPKQNHVEAFLHMQSIHKKIQIDFIDDGYEEYCRNVNVARETLGLRELVKFEYIKGYEILRKISLKINELLNWSDELIFNLDPHEIFSLSSENSEEMYLKAIKRKEDRILYKEFHIPKVLFSNRLNDLDFISVKNSDVLKGIGVAAYQCEGEVVVIKSLEELTDINRLGPGKILVVTTTDPAWSSIISLVCPNGGLITEIGGLLAHGANYARDMKIAAVLNVTDATKILKTGMIVHVDGLKGVINIKN